MPQSNERPLTVNLFDWAGGIRNAGLNPLAFPANALISGENIEINGRSLRTRAGISFHTGPENGFGPSGTAAEAVQLIQARFPSNETSYLIAQVRTSSGDDLYASPNHLPVSGGAQWTKIYSLGSGAGVISCALLNDRAVFTEGVNVPPLVFAGCLDDSAADWAIPKAVLLSCDNGASWTDIGAAVLDKDPDTVASIGGLPAGSGLVAVCVDMAQVSGLHFAIASPNTIAGPLRVEGWSGAWGSGAGVRDDTSGMAQTGAATFSGTPFSGTHTMLNRIPGFWFRIGFPSGTSSGASLRNVLFAAPCQPLQSIGDGEPELPLGFIFRDVSVNSAKDFTTEVSDGVLQTFARLNDGDIENPVGMQTADELYIGGTLPFSGVEIAVHNDYRNNNVATLSGRYWTGTAWSNLTGFADGTQAPSGKPFGVNGPLSWTVPPDWMAVRPISSGYAHGYWMMLKSSAPLSAKTYLSEVRVWPVMEPLKKHRFALTVRDRMILLGRSDAPDRVAVSRSLEECGFTGRDSATFRIGGRDVIVGAAEAFNQGFIAKSEDWYILNGYNPRTFSVERAEVAGNAPVNNRVIVRAPHPEADMKNLMGLYYLNHAGAWHFAGLKVYRLNGDVSWWDRSSPLPRLDLDRLHLACGAYWPEKDRIVWAVPMIVSGDSQSFNNRLIVYDAGSQSWAPPCGISVASLTPAIHYQANAPGKIGAAGLYAGDYSGRVLRLFDPAALDDPEGPICGYAETGHIDFGAPEYVKLVRTLTAYGRSSGGLITVKAFTDGGVEPSAECAFEELGADGASFSRRQRPLNLMGRFFSFRVEFSGAAELFGLQASVSVVRDWGAM